MTFLITWPVAVTLSARAADGSGYEFLADMVLKVDKLNQQVGKSHTKATGRAGSSKTGWLVVGLVCVRRVPALRAPQLSVHLSLFALGAGPAGGLPHRVCLHHVQEVRQGAPGEGCPWHVSWDRLFKKIKRHGGKVKLYTAQSAQHAARHAHCQCVLLSHAGFCCTPRKNEHCWSFCWRRP